MIKLVASDLDGTLLRDGAMSLNPEIYDLILRLKAKGIAFAAASGRQIYSIRHLFEPIVNDIYYIAENGSLAVCNGQVISRGLIDRDLGLRIFQAVRVHGGCQCFVSCESRGYTEFKEPRFLNHMHNVAHFDIEEVECMDDITEPFIKMAICDFNGTDEIFPYFNERFGNEIEIVTSGNEWIDFIAPNANKGIALENLCRHLGIRREECIAFGDQFNDIAMLEYAGTSYAMSTCAPGVEKHANFQTDSVEEILRSLL